MGKEALNLKDSKEVSEFGSRMELYEKNSECLWEIKTKVSWSQFLQNKELFLECVFVLFPGVVDKSEFTSEYLLQLDIVICLYASMKNHFFFTCSLPATYDLPLWLDTLPMWLFLTLWIQIDVLNNVGYCIEI